MGNSISIGCAYKDQDLTGSTLTDCTFVNPTGITALASLSVTGATTLNGNVAIGNASTDLIAFHGQTACDQAAYVAQLSTSTGVTGAVGFTATQAAAILAGINSILTLLIEKGLMAAS
jgi:hypothetical protein